MKWVIMGNGGFAICGTALNCDWFMNHRKAQVLRMFERSGTRVFYGLLGTALVAVGVHMAMGIIQESQ